MWGQKVITNTLPQITDLRCSAKPLHVYEALANREVWNGVRCHYHGLLMSSYFAGQQLDVTSIRASYPLLQQQHPYLNHLTIRVDFNIVQLEYATTMIDGQSQAVMMPELLHGVRQRFAMTNVSSNA